MYCQKEGDSQNEKQPARHIESLSNRGRGRRCQRTLKDIVLDNIRFNRRRDEEKEGARNDRYSLKDGPQKQREYVESRKYWNKQRDQRRKQWQDGSQRDRKGDNKGHDGHDGDRRRGNDDRGGGGEGYNKGVGPDTRGQNRDRQRYVSGPEKDNNKGFNHDDRGQNRDRQHEERRTEQDSKGFDRDGRGPNRDIQRENKRTEEDNKGFDRDGEKKNWDKEADEGVDNKEKIQYRDKKKWPKVLFDTREDRRDRKTHEESESKDEEHRERKNDRRRRPRRRRRQTPSDGELLNGKQTVAQDDEPGNKSSAEATPEAPKLRKWSEMKNRGKVDHPELESRKSEEIAAEEPVEPERFSTEPEPAPVSSGRKRYSAQLQKPVMTTAVETPMQLIEIPETSSREPKIIYVTPQEMFPRRNVMLQNSHYAMAPLTNAPSGEYVQSMPTMLPGQYDPPQYFTDPNTGMVYTPQQPNVMLQNSHYAMAPLTNAPPGECVQSMPTMLPGQYDPSQYFTDPNTGMVYTPEQPY